MSDLNLPDEFRRLEKLALGEPHQKSVPDLYYVYDLMFPVLTALSESRDEVDVLIDVDVCFKVDRYDCQERTHWY